MSLISCSVGETPGDADYTGAAPPTSASASASATDTDGETTDTDSDGGSSGAVATSDDTNSATEMDVTSASTSTGDETTGNVSASGETLDCTPGQEMCVCDGELCDQGLVCLEGLCVPDDGPMCDDDPAQNDSQATAKHLGDLSEGESSTVQGVVIDPDDTDWFSYHGTDTLLSESDPQVAVLDGDGLRVCLYIDCDNDMPATPNCPVGTAQETSPSGDAGCCAMNSNNVELASYECANLQLGDDSATFYIAVTPTDMCVSFDVLYAY